MKKILIPLVLVILLLIGGLVYLYKSLNDQKATNSELKEYQELAELDKKEMENEYEQFAQQYSEMRSQITNDSLITQLTNEQEKTQKLLQELRSLKGVNNKNIAEITRLKKELETCRAVIRSYVLEIDSLNRLNQNLTAENTRVKAENEEANRQIEGLNSEKASLSEKVAIAAQLDAIGINLSMLDKKDKSCKSVNKCKKLQLNFSLAKNVTASSGTKTVYVRITSPAGSLLSGGGSFNYENKSLQCTAKRSVEYGGKETPITIYWPVTTALESGTYQVSIFADGNMIGSRSFSFK